MRDCQSGGTREKIAAPPLSANNQPLPDPTLCSAQSLICSWEILEWRCCGMPAPVHSCRGARRLPGAAPHTHRVCKCRDSWGSGSPVPHAWCGVCPAQDCGDRHTRAPGPAKHFRASHGHRAAAAMSYPIMGSLHSWPVNKPLANCCQARTTPGEEEFPCKMQDHTHRPATAQQGDLCLV